MAFAKQVGAETKFDTSGTGYLDCILTHLEYAVVLRQHRRGKTDLRTDLVQGLVGNQRWHHDRAEFNHALGSGGIESVAVFDALHAVLDRQLDRRRQVRVRRGVSMAMVRLDSDSPDLFGRELHRVKRVTRRRHAARGHDLYELRSIAERMSSRLATGVDTIHHETGMVMEHLAAALGRRDIAGAEVAMPAGLRQNATCLHDPRAGACSVGNSPHEAAVVATCISDGGEAAPDRALGQAGTHDAAFFGGHRREPSEVHGHDPVVKVPIYKARHDELSGGVDVNICLDARPAIDHVDDAVRFDHHGLVLYQFHRFGVEHRAFTDCHDHAPTLSQCAHPAPSVLHVEQILLDMQHRNPAGAATLSDSLRRWRNWQTRQV